MTTEDENGTGQQQNEVVDPPTSQNEAQAPEVPQSVAETKENSDSSPAFVLGVDFGTDTAVIACASLKTIKPEILRNDISNQKTPVTIAFQGNERAFGDLAVQVATANKDSTISGVLRALGCKSVDDFKASTPFCTGRVEETENGLAFKVDYNGDELLLHPEQVMASFLAKFRKFANSKIKDGKVAASIVIPDCFTDDQRAAVRTASEISGVNVVQVIDRSAAIALNYGTKKSEEVLGDACVMYADIGHGYVTVSVYQWKGKTATKLAQQTVSDIGSAIIDEAIFDELNKICESKYGQKLAKNSKGAIRLRAVCRKLKETLSGVSEAAATCENLIDGQDICFTFTREKLEQACTEAKEKMLTLVKQVKESLKDDVKVSSCELVGGGFRVPWVKNAITEILGEDVPLSYTMDSMAAASMGATFAAARLFEPTGGIRRPAFDNLAKIEGDDGIYSLDSLPHSMEEERLLISKKLQQQLEDADRNAAEMKEARNKLEAFIFETRSAATSGGKFSELIKNDECVSFLNAAEEWLYDYENGGAKDDVTKDDFVNKYKALIQELEPSCSDYRKALEEERMKKEKELEEGAAKAAAELEASGGKDDHDFRKLSKPDRMKKVIMNKDEGTSLFKDGNFEPASLRYKRSLQHCDKFFDLSEEDKKEIEDIKLSLHLNIAMCHIKLEAWEFALKHIDEALKIDPESCKALYRRALVLEKQKDFDKAKNDLLKAQKISPDDKAVIRLMERVNIQIKRQDAKAKKMAQKMFG
mmetsp:Transcript_11818/g.14701  ORF Transcript_11818/g.14701 Transcript_11818/m.14701 type:complete len:760 (+) Transcript_11818:157-2436(+)